MNARLKQALAVDYVKNNLASTAGRTALLVGITAGTVTQKEIERAVLIDNEKRPHRKPVVAYGKRYSSVRQAATSQLAAELVGARSGPNYARMLNCEEKRIAYLCNKDDTVGFYWSE